MQVTKHAGNVLSIIISKEGVGEPTSTIKINVAPEMFAFDLACNPRGAPLWSSPQAVAGRTRENCCFGRLLRDHGSLCMPFTLTRTVATRTVLFQFFEPFPTAMERKELVSPSPSRQPPPAADAYFITMMCFASAFFASYKIPRNSYW